jgi:uncharacterized membrane protein YphA (DoxX/SURF4 family)
MPARALGAGIALSIWLLIFRVAGVACVVDGASKLGWLPAVSPEVAADTFQPSPLGPVSAVIEIVAGLFLVAGLRTRTASLVLVGHLALGMFVAWRHHLSPFGVNNWGVNVFLLTPLAIVGPGMFSLDFLCPDLINKHFFNRPKPPAAT